jgi:alginate O-acetyltransferase complex protein AlgI
VSGLSAAQASRLGAAAPLVPLGFSFLAFELMHFVIECRRGRIQQPRLIDVAAFAFFFPCRIAGPIKRYPAFLTAVADARPSIDEVYAGMVRVLVGILKKVAIADPLALTSAEVLYADTPLHVWRVVLAYGVQLYVDFSAYSDIAIGISRILGITVPENFNWPYLSPNIQEFWNRWHMTLSGWARDYVFSPAGRALFKTTLRSRPAAIAAISYLATFLVIGAWHGVSANFLVWGAYHGLLLSAYHLYRTRIPASVAASSWFHSPVVTMLATAITFVVVTIGWFPFMTTLPNAMRLLRIAAGGH